uniref:hypothetical protein n=1 Tax=Agathobaculum desmolans TaxID=39484 RepID=UPI000556CF75
MPNFTPHLQLEKPTPEDFYDVEVLNKNWDKIDEELPKRVPQTRTINKKPLSADVTLTGEDIKVTGSDETTIHTRLSEITNPNLLDNWYFGNPVNQRAASEYSGSWSYCIDRWVAEGIITVGKEGVSASSRDASNPAYFLQRFEHFPDGRQVTFSLLTDNKLYAITGVKNGEMGFSKTFDDGVI